jgi:hypothetical protein
MLEMLNGVPDFRNLSPCAMAARAVVLRDFYSLQSGDLSTQSPCYARNTSHMAAQNNAPLPDGLEIGGYRIVKKIASGGFSIVYLAYDADGNAVAVKEYLPSALALRQPGELAPVIAKANLPVFRIGLKCFFEEGGRWRASSIRTWCGC